MTHLGFLLEGRHYIIQKDDHVYAETEIQGIPIPRRALRLLEEDKNSTLAEIIRDEEELIRIGIAFHNERIPVFSHGTRFKWPEDSNNKKKKKQDPKLCLLFYASSAPVIQERLKIFDD